MTPWISNNPLLHSISFRKTNDGYIMVNIAILAAGLYVVGVFIVAHERVCHDATRYRTSLLHLVHDRQFVMGTLWTLESTPSVHVEVVIGFRHIATIRGAVEAYDVIFTLETIIQPLGLVVRAGLIRQSFGLHVLIYRRLVSAVTSVLIGHTWEYYLRWDLYRRELGLPHDFDAIWNDRDCCKCPAWPTVDRNVLVADCSCLIDSIHIPPIVCGWKFISF